MEVRNEVIEGATSSPDREVNGCQRHIEEKGLTMSTYDEMLERRNAKIAAWKSLSPAEQRARTLAKAEAYRLAEACEITPVAQSSASGKVAPTTGERMPNPVGREAVAGWVQGEADLHMLAKLDGPCLDPRAKGETRELDGHDRPLMVDTEDVRLAQAWNRTRQVIARFEDDSVRLPRDLAAWMNLRWPSGSLARTKRQGKAIDTLIRRLSTLGDDLVVRLDDVYRETGYSLASPIYGCGDEVVGVEWHSDTPEEMLHLTAQEALVTARNEQAYLSRDDLDVELEARRNAEMRPKDDEGDIPTRQGGQYIGTLETEFSFLMQRIRDLRGSYSEMLSAAMDAGFSKERAKGHAQLVYKANEARAMIDRFNVRRCVNALEQMKDAPDFPSAWKAVMARKAETGATYGHMLKAYTGLIGRLNMKALVGDGEWIGVEGLYRMSAPAAVPTRVAAEDREALAALRGRFQGKVALV